MLSRWMNNYQILVKDNTDDQLHRAQTLNAFLIATFGIVNLWILLLTLGSPLPWVTILAMLPIDLALLLAHFLLHRGRLRLAASLTIICVWGCITLVSVFLHGGISSPTVAGYLLVILGAGVFMSGRSALFFTALSWIALLGIFAAEVQGIIPAALIPITPGRALLMHSLIFVMGTVLISTAVQGMHYAINRAQCHEDNLTEKNIQLQEVLANLEERIADRTSEILQQKQFYQALVDNSPIAIVTLDMQHHILSCNPAFEALFGYTTEETTDQDLDNLITTPSNWFEASNYTQKVLKGETIKCTAKRRRKDGGLIDVDIYGVPVQVDGQHLGVLGMYHDISERVQAETHLRFLATHDSLTGLPNRSLFYEHLDHALAIGRRSQTRVATFFLDLDGFKEVNNLLGHSKGDVLLEQVAERLQSNLRSSDLVARLGGDEFAFVFENIRTPDDAGLIAEKILASLSRPFILDGNELCISGSIGISIFPEDGDESKDLLRFADAAMYRVKGQGKHHYQFFSRICLHEEWSRDVHTNHLIQNPIR